MSAIEKTKAIQRLFLPIGVLVPNPNNPNKMTDAQFNLLADNIEKTGITDPILVRPIEGGLYRIIGGHHRYDYAKLEGFEEVPCTIINDPEFDEDAENFQVVRMNTIRGSLSPEKFLKMYQSLSKKYSDEILLESFGFAEEEDFDKLIKSVSASLPKEVKLEFDKSAKEIKTIEGLSKLLNHLFSNYGSTLPVGYMVFDYGGKESIWLRMSKETRKAMTLVGKMCVTEKRTVDDIIGGLIRQMAAGKHSEALLQLIAESKEVEMPEGAVMPTEDSLQLPTKE
jgi:hypothetical protein